MRYVLAFSGSPRRGGNSETLLDQALAGAEAAGGKTEKIILNELKITPCQECGGCDKTGLCIVDDDMQTLYPKLDAAQIVILASPVFFSGLSAQAKAMIDRCQCHWVRKYLLRQSPPRRQRPGAFLLVRGQAGLEIFQAAAKPVRAMFATEDIGYSRELFVERVDAKGAIEEYPILLEKAYCLGQELINMLCL